MKKIILVTGVGGDIGRSIVRCLRDTQYPLTIVGCDCDRYAAGKHDVDQFLLAPRVTDQDAYMNFLSTHIRPLGIYAIFPAVEQELDFFDRNRTLIASWNIHLAIPSHDILTAFFDKYNTVQYLTQYGIPVPRTCLLHDNATHLGFPIIAKPRRGAGSIGVILIEDEADLIYCRHKNRDMVLQEYVGNPDDEYTACVFRSEQHTYAIAFKRVLGFNGVSKITHLSHDESALNIASLIGNTTGLIGSINIQMRKTDKGFVVFEINPRFSSTVYIRHVFGFQDVCWTLDTLQGNQVCYEKKYISGTCIRTLNEVFMDMIPDQSLTQ
jgi:carbamoyl-phosphate synthase large subunit